MRRLLIVSSVAVLLCVGTHAHAQQKSTASQDSQPFVKPCTVKNPQPCADKPPRPTYTPTPECSKEARKKKINGSTVELTIVVATDGFVRDISVSKPVGYYGLDDAAIKAVKKWRFKPGTSLGKPAPVQILVEVEFRCDLS